MIIFRKAYCREVCAKAKSLATNLGSCFRENQDNIIIETYLYNDGPFTIKHQMRTLNPELRSAMGPRRAETVDSTSVDYQGRKVFGDVNGRFILIRGEWESKLDELYQTL